MAAQPPGLAEDHLEETDATVVAEESSSFFVLTAPAFHQLFTKPVAIRLLLNIVGTLSERLRKTNNELLAQRQKS